jgi:tungstate transport system permease protein
MDFIREGIVKALHIIRAHDPEVFGILWLTLRVAGISTTIAMLLGVPLGFIVAISTFRGKSVVQATLNALMSLPTVTVGLVVYAFISRHGPLGDLELLFTPSAIIIGQVILILPVMAALSCSAVRHIDVSVRKTALTLGAGPLRAAFAVLREGRYAIMAAVAAGFGRALTEVGSATMLGGNIRGVTRTMTTAIAFETGKGEFGFSIALGLMLLLMAFAVTAVFHLLQRQV